MTSYSVWETLAALVSWNHELSVQFRVLTSESSFFQHDAIKTLKKVKLRISKGSSPLIPSSGISVPI